MHGDRERTRERNTDNDSSDLLSWKLPAIRVMGSFYGALHVPNETIKVRRV